jgi:hypothetical protein
MAFYGSNSAPAFYSGNQLAFDSPDDILVVTWEDIFFYISYLDNEDHSEESLLPYQDLFAINQIALISGGKYLDGIRGTVTNFYSVPSSPVPEPSTIFLISVGLVALAAKRKFSKG